MGMARTSFGLFIAAALMLSMATTTSAQDEQNIGQGTAYKDLRGASELISLGRHEAAERLLVDLSEDLPEAASVWYQLALVRQLRGKPLEAKKPILKALELSKEDVNALLLAAEIFRTTDQTKAKTWALKAGGLASKDAKVLKKVIELLLKMRDVESALPLLAKALEEDPKNMDLLDLQARLALQAHKPKVAAKAYRKILAQKPRDPHAAESLAFTLVVADQKREAIKAFEKLLKINPSNIRGRRKLISLMLESGYSEEQVGVQKKYLEYYKWVRQRAAKKAAETAKKNARLGIRTRGTRGPRMRGSTPGK